MNNYNTCTCPQGEASIVVMNLSFKAKLRPGGGECPEKRVASLGKSRAAKDETGFGEFVKTVSSE